MSYFHKGQIFTNAEFFAIAKISRFRDLRPCPYFMKIYESFVVCVTQLTLTIFAIEYKICEHHIMYSILQFSP